MGGAASEKQGAFCLFRQVADAQADVARHRHYIGLEKCILHRCIAERGIVLTPEAQARLDAMPESFADFLAAPAGLDVAA